MVSLSEPISKPHSTRDWDRIAKFLVASFRADVARAGAMSEARQLVDELSATSPEFASLWENNEVQIHGEGTKRLRVNSVGSIELEYSSFFVEGRPDLGLIVYNPVSADDADHIRSLLKAS